MKASGAPAGSAAAAGPDDARKMRMKLVHEAGLPRLKIVESASDLAINGAPPMFNEPLHVGRPNIGNHERFLKRASEILDRGWLSNNGPVAQEFEQRIATFLGVSIASQCAMGRSLSKSRPGRSDSRAKSSFRPIRSSRPPMRCNGRKSLRSSPISILQRTISIRRRCGE